MTNTERKAVYNRLHNIVKTRIEDSVQRYYQATTPEQAEDSLMAATRNQQVLLALEAIAENYL